MQTYKVDSGSPNAEAVAAAVRVLDAGGLVAFPTETVYGLAADAGNSDARTRLYEAKGRPPDQACAYLVADRESAAALVADFPPLAERLAAAFWPGPLTLVVPGPEGKRVGLRLPSDAVAQELARAAARPLFQTSANLHGQAPARSAQEVVAAMGDRVDLVLDGGPAGEGPPSTVVDVDAARYSVLRAGAIGEPEIERAAARLVLVVCTGNICRSPLAEAYLQRDVANNLECAFEETPQRGWRFGSAGTMTRTGIPPSDPILRIAEGEELDVTGHRSRRFDPDLLKESWRIYCVTRGHREFLLPYLYDREQEIQLLDPDGRDIEDPYGRSLRTYRRVARLLAQACERRALELVEAS